MALLELQEITKDFPGVRALDRVSFDLEKGEVHALCGENGAGKSTLIKVLSGFYPHGAYGGRVRLRGVEARFADMRAAERAGIAVIAQDLALVPEMSVAENLMLGREPVRRGLIRWDRVRVAAVDALSLAGCDADPDAPVRTLGVGQQQMVEIARALDKRSEILVLDEPTAALTQTDARRLLGLLRKLRARGVSSIYISHRLEEVFTIADRITVLRDGRAVATGPLGRSGSTAGGWTPDRVIAAMVGREIRNLYPPPGGSPGPAALAAEDWRVTDPENPGRFVVDGVSLEAREGEVLGIAGLMGSGRTALVASLFGVARGAVSGSLAVAGRASRAPFRDPAEAIAAGVALVGEDRKRYGLVSSASVLENLTLPSLGRFRRGALLDDEARSREAREQVEALSIKTPSLSSPVENLSGGTQQKIALGKWLLTRPRVLFLDEPTRGIDVGSKAEIHQIAGRLARQGVAIVLVSSDLPELLGLSDRVLVLSQGRRTALLPRSLATPEASFRVSIEKPIRNNALLYHQGQMKVLQPAISRGDIRIVSDQWARDWLAVEALKIMENALTRSDNRVDAVVAANDGVAGGAIQALAEQNLAGRTLVSGQDAELSACQRIAAGTQSMTVYKPIRRLAYKAAEVAVKMARRQPPGEATRGIPNGRIDVPSILLPPVAVDKDNLMSTVIADGYQKLEDVYRDVPRPKK